MNHQFKAALFALAVAAVPTVAVAEGIERLAKNIYDQSLAPAPDAESVKSALARMRPDGSYDDLDYASTVRAGWKPQNHLNRLNELANAWCDPSGPHHRDPAVQAAIVKGYRFWVSKDAQSTNWFFNVIGVPQRLGSLMLKMQQNDFLPQDNFTKAIAILHRSAKGQGGASSGANLCSQAACTIHEGILRYRARGASAAEKAAAAALIQKSYDYLGGTLAVATNLEDDGIRVDRSYQSHEQTLYDGGYGMTLLTHTAKSASWGAGTGFGLSPANVRQLVDYLLDGGPQWMVRGLTYDPLACGRYWSRVGQVNMAAGLRGPIDTALAISGDYRRAELITLRDRVADAAANNTATPMSGPTGNRAYWVSDYMTHQRPGYMLSVAGASTRTNTPESINGENLKAGYGTAGVNLTLRTGHEYDGIYAVWDWYRLPGTTSERSPDGTGGSYSVLPDHHFAKTDAVGGASDGNVGAFLYPMSEYQITANKAYFFFDRGLVALGNSITQKTANTPDGVVGTTLNQALLRGSVSYGASDGKSTSVDAGKTVRPDDLRWVNHDSVAYLALSPKQKATIRTVRQHGTWRSINETGPLDDVDLGVFSVDFDHGSRPTDASYAYAVVPNVTADQTAALFASKPFTVLRNDATVQAVSDPANGCTQVVFHGNGSVRLGKQIELSQTGSAGRTVVIWSAKETSVKLSVAGVDRRSKTATFTVSQRLEGNGASFNPSTGLTTITLTLPAGTSAGSTLSRSFTVVGDAG